METPERYGRIFQWGKKIAPAGITSTDRGRSCVICQKTTQYDTFIIAQLRENCKELI